MKSEFTNPYNILKTKEKTPINGVSHMMATLTDLPPMALPLAEPDGFISCLEILQLKTPHLSGAFLIGDPNGIPKIDPNNKLKSLKIFLPIFDSIFLVCHVCHLFMKGILIHFFLYVKRFKKKVIKTC